MASTPAARFAWKEARKETAIVRCGTSLGSLMSQTGFSCGVPCRIDAQGRRR